MWECRECSKETDYKPERCSCGSYTFEEVDSQRERTMTKRYNALTVVLDHDVRSDDAEPLIEAIKQLKGVLEVHPHVGDLVEVLAQDRARNELGQKLWEVLYPKK